MLISHTNPTRYTILFYAIAVCWLLSSCSFNKSDRLVNTNVAPADVSQHEREMAALAFIAYTGELLKGSDDDVERELAPCINRELSRQPFTQNKYELVWGPAVYKFELAERDDNMLYGVRNLEQPDHLVIGIRGTNATAILDWLVEDLEVAHKVTWPYTHPSSGLKPQIAEGTNKGLRILQAAMPADGVPGAQLTIRDFLKQAVASSGVRHISVTGHSLGGALAPTFALWLADTRDQWDPRHSATLSVVALAGPTPGDQDFSRYYEQRLGATTKRIHNPYDVVPLAWSVDTLDTIPNLYRSAGIHAPLAIEAALSILIEVVKHKRYTQILPQSRVLAGNVFPANQDFVQQLAWQHSCGYYCGMNLLPKLQPVSADCKDFDPVPECNHCP